MDHLVFQKDMRNFENLLSLNESLNPMGHIKKFELIKGDANKLYQNF